MLGQIDFSFTPSKIQIGTQLSLDAISDINEDITQRCAKFDDRMSFSWSIGHQNSSKKIKSLPTVDVNFSAIFCTPSLKFD